jgi:hypothetical protein
LDRQDLIEIVTGLPNSSNTVLELPFPLITLPKLFQMALVLKSLASDKARCFWRTKLIAVAWITAGL